MIAFAVCLLFVWNIFLSSCVWFAFDTMKDAMKRELEREARKELDAKLFHAFDMVRRKP
jgi:hypothetical protein